MKKLILSTIIGSSMLFSGLANAEPVTYNIDKKGQHAFVQFKIQHLGYSWLLGEFTDFDGSFTIDKENPSNNSANVVIQTASIDSNHAERDKHLRNDDFLNVEKYPTATFESTNFRPLGEEGDGILEGNFTLNGVTQNIEIGVRKVGEGEDPWGGYRAGFEGSTVLTLSDYNIDYDLGEKSKNVEIYISLEGVKQ